MENETKNEENIEFFKKIAMLFFDIFSLGIWWVLFLVLVIFIFFYGLKLFFFGHILVLVFDEEK